MLPRLDRARVSRRVYDCVVDLLNDARQKNRRTKRRSAKEDEVDDELVKLDVVLTRDASVTNC